MALVAMSPQLMNMKNSWKRKMKREEEKQCALRLILKKTNCEPNFSAKVSGKLGERVAMQGAVLVRV